MSSAKRILVTGGAGFLGSHLCERLFASGHDVLCVDNFFIVARTTSRICSTTGASSCCATTSRFHSMSRSTRSTISPAPLRRSTTSSIPSRRPRPASIGAINMLGLAKRLKISFLQASTSEVYGDPDGHPQTEDYWGNVNPIGPRSCYDEGKRCAETLFSTTCASRSSPPRSCASSTPTGRACTPTTAASSPTSSCRRCATRTHALRRRAADPFILLRRRPDRGMVRMMATPPDVTGPINIGNPGEFTIRELAELSLNSLDRSRNLCSAPCPGRPQAVSARYPPRSRDFRLVANRTAARGSHEDHPLFRDDAAPGT